MGINPSKPIQPTSSFYRRATPRQNASNSNYRRQNTIFSSNISFNETSILHRHRVEAVSMPSNIQNHVNPYVYYDPPPYDEKSSEMQTNKESDNTICLIDQLLNKVVNGDIDDFRTGCMGLIRMILHYHNPMLEPDLGKSEEWKLDERKISEITRIACIRYKQLLTEEHRGFSSFYRYMRKLILSLAFHTNENGKTEITNYIKKELPQFHRTGSDLAKSILSQINNKRADI